MQKTYYFHSKERKNLEFIINDARPEDLAEIVKVFRLVRESVYSEWFDTLESNIAKPVIDNEGFAVVVRHEGKIVGFGSAITTGKKANILANDLIKRDVKIPQGKNSELHDIFVHPGLRGYGLQRAIINTLCDEAASRGTDITFVAAHPENIYRICNFEKCGFIKANEEPIDKCKSKRDYWFKIIVE
jgi:ribosomal protein S18 acetylase RimI-like enzyme